MHKKARGPRNVGEVLTTIVLVHKERERLLALLDTSEEEEQETSTTGPVQIE